MARTPKDLPAIQDRRAEVVKLRAQGLTWDQVAAEVGYANGSSALKAWRAAIKQKPDLAVTEIRAAERERLEQMDAELARIISQGGPIKTTSIGRVMYDVRTCTCRAGNTPDHEPGCEVKPVVDEGVVIAALKERRQVGESYRRLTSADAPPAAPVVSEGYLRAVQVHRELAQQAPAITRPALPAGYGDMSPEQQLQAVMNRERTHRDAILAAIPQPGDHVVVQAEIVG